MLNQCCVPSWSSSRHLYHIPQIPKSLARDTPYCARSTLDIVVQVRYSMVCAPVRSITPSLKLGDYLSVQAHKPCSISHLLGIILSQFQNRVPLKPMLRGAGSVAPLLHYGRNPPPPPPHTHTTHHHHSAYYIFSGPLGSLGSF